MKILIIIYALMAAFCLHSTIINIPADFSTIQAGIDSSADADTVLVQPGTYIENIDFNGHLITLGSLFLTTADTSYIPLTVIDGDASGSVVSFLSGEDSTAVITGLTIQNGFTWDGGGGILCDSSDPVITNNIIKDNQGDAGGGILCTSSNAKIFYNNIHHNTFISVLGCPGGGISCLEGSDCIIMYNSIHHNQNQDGAGIAVYNSDAVVSYNVIYENETWDLGGAMRFRESNTMINNNTFWGNTANSAGGIYVDYGCNLTVVNNIFWNNIANDGEVFFGVFGGISVVYSDVEGGYAGIGNIDEDPLFVDPENSNFHLQENSPCIDAGDPAFPFDPDGTISDMGAIYFDQNGSSANENIQYSTDNFQLSNYPNPFNPSTTVSFSLTTENTESTELIIYNMKGQKVKTLVNERLDSGIHQVIWNGTDKNNKPVSSGIYLYKLKYGTYSSTKKMILMK